MTNRIRRAAVIGLAAASLALAPRAQGAKPQQQQKDVGAARLAELQEFSRKSAELAARIPGEYDPAEEERRTRTMADKAALGKIDIKHDDEIERELFDGQFLGVVLHRIEVSGRAPFDKIHQFLIYRGSLNRLVQLEMLHLKAEEGGAVSFEAVFVFPRAVPHEATADTEVDRRELTYHMLSEVTARSNKLTWWIEALAAFGGTMENRTMALNDVRFGDEQIALIEGKVSNGSRDRVKPAFEKAGFRVLDLQMSPAGNCQTFSIALILEASDQQEKTTRGADPFKAGPACD